MNISEMINRLQEIKEMHGDMVIYLKGAAFEPLQSHQIICIAKGNSRIYPDGIYIEGLHK